jgi:conjugative relaxase-like TrwC/TraI family protein
MLHISKPVSATSLDFLFGPSGTDGYSLNHWLGHGSQELGLEGSVGPGDVRALLEGRLTRGRQPARLSDRFVPAGGMILCFTPPASVTVLWSQLDKDLRRTIQAINHEAARNAISYLQDESRLMPSNLDPHPRDEIGFVGALFAQGLGQNQVPELHTHVLLSNVCIHSDGSFGGLDQSRLLQLKSAAEAIFGLSLAHGLQTQLGVRLVRNADSFEIAGVPSIESWQLSRSPNAAPSNKAVADASIPAEQGFPEAPTNAFGRWQEIGRQHGWGPDQASKLLALDLRIETYVSPHEVFATAETLRAPFGHHDIVRALATHFQTSTVSYAGLKAAINREVHGLETVRSNSGETLYHCGMRLVRDSVPPRDLNHPAGDEGHRLPKQSVEVLLKSSVLTEHQKAAFRFMTTTVGPTKALCNFGETERQALMSLAEKQWTAAGLRVVGVCGNAERATQFQDSTNIATVTAAQALRRGPFSLKSLIQPFALKVGGTTIDRRCVVVAEDAHRIGRTQLKMLQDRCAQAGAKLVVLGNAEQLPTIHPREMFRSKYAADYSAGFCSRRSVSRWMGRGRSSKVTIPVNTTATILHRVL